MVFCNEILCIIRAIEIAAGRVLAGSSMVTADDEVSRAVILADDRMPYSLARARHAHGQGEESQVTHAVRILFHDRLVHSYAGIVVDIARLGEADDGMDEDIRLSLPCRPYGEFTMCPVHRVASLESDDFSPRELFEVRSELGRGD